MFIDLLLGARLSNLDGKLVGSSSSFDSSSMSIELSDSYCSSIDSKFLNILDFIGVVSSYFLYHVLLLLTTFFSGDTVSFYSSRYTMAFIFCLVVTMSRCSPSSNNSSTYSPNSNLIRTRCSVLKVSTALCSIDYTVNMRTYLVKSRSLISRLLTESSLIF
jgi:hypothetical protein